MKTFKVKCLLFDGNIRILTAKFDCPDFTDDEPMVFKTFSVPGQTKESKMVAWLDGQDKRNWMDDNDVHTIIDYYVPVKKVKDKDTFESLCKQFEISNPQLIVDLLATKLCLAESLKGLSVKKQFEICLKSLNTSYAAKIESYKYVNKMLKAGSTEELKKVIEQNRNQKLLS